MILYIFENKEINQIEIKRLKYSAYSKTLDVKPDL